MAPQVVPAKVYKAMEKEVARQEKKANAEIQKLREMKEQLEGLTTAEKQSGSAGE